MKASRATAQENHQSLYAVDITAGPYHWIGDETTDLGGGALGPAPFDHLTAALAECTAMTLRWYAQKHHIALHQVSVDVAYGPQQSGTPDAQNMIFSKKITLVGDLSSEEREKLLQMAARCPVQKVLRKINTIVSCDAMAAAESQNP